MKSAKGLVAQANARVKTVPAQDAVSMLHDADTIFVDLRDSAELQRDGKIPGAVHVNRGMLEFALDSSLPYHNPVFSSGKSVMFYCASGGRSALAADTARKWVSPRSPTWAAASKPGKTPAARWRNRRKSRLGT